MTAEVAVINSIGVALAADSAVTIGRDKIYNSALKLFSLSKVEPVGVMIYGNAALMDVPWEVIIKSFRKEIGSKSYPTLEDYSSNFLNYLSKNKSFFSDKVQETWFIENVYSYFHQIRDNLIESVDIKIKNDGNISENETELIFQETITNFLNDLEKLEIIKTMTKNSENEIRKKYRKVINALKKDVFKDLSLSRKMNSQLNRISSLLHTRDIFSERKSGIVIAGFGTDNIYPVVVTHEIEGIICGKVKCKFIDNKSVKIENGSHCSVIPFAQDDMVASFMNGLNPTVQRFLHSFLNNLFQRLPEVIDTNNLKGTKKEKEFYIDQYSKDIGSLLKDFFDEFKKHTQEQHVNPIMQMVNALPKDELAAMAESLVNLTAFKRRMSKVLETVGGPIDVIVISKGDGLVWVKRKMYFPAELNQHFFQNYFKEC